MSAFAYMCEKSLTLRPSNYKYNYDLSAHLGKQFEEIGLNHLANAQLHVKVSIIVNTQKIMEQQ